MQLYIDPGTGSLLFAILIGIVGAINYAFRMALVKVRFVLSGGKQQANAERIPYVIFSDHKRYWNVFEPVCRELERRGIEVTYLTASPDDPALESGLSNVKAEFIGEGNKAFGRLNLLRADVVLSTTPGLDVYQWKRSKEVGAYVHILHAAGEVVMYRMFGLDYYDAVLVAGEHQKDQIRELEAMRGLPAKELPEGGIPYMDEMARRLEEDGPVPEHPRTVLLAPSWGPSAIFSRFGGEVIDALLATGYHVIVRPHPQSFTSEREMLERIMAEHPASDQLEWNRDTDNFEVLRRSDILISDFSGVTFDFALVYDKPIIYADTEFDPAPYDAWWLKRETWTQQALPRIGAKLDRDALSDIKSVIDACLEDPRYAAGRAEVRDEAWMHRGEGARLTMEYLVEKRERLLAETASEGKAGESAGSPDDGSSSGRKARRGLFGKRAKEEAEAGQVPRTLESARGGVR